MGGQTSGVAIKEEARCLPYNQPSFHTCELQCRHFAVFYSTIFYTYNLHLHLDHICASATQLLLLRPHEPPAPRTLLPLGGMHHNLGSSEEAALRCYHALACLPRPILRRGLRST